MPKSTELTDFERGQIVGLSMAGWGDTAIHKRLGHPRTTIQSIVKRYNEDGATTTATRSGRPPKLTERDERTLIREVKKNRNATVKEITEQINKSLPVSVGVHTVQTTLHEYGFYGRIAKKKPFVSEGNRKIRAKWCRERKDWIVEWDKVIFSDESRFEIFHNDSHKWVWRRADEKFKKECLSPTVKHSQGVMVWGYFIKNRVGPLVIIEGTVNAKKYIELLEENLLPFLDELEESETYIFQDDNAPCHTARLVKSWKEENSINFLPWPFQSSDLNPIENLWDELERRVRGSQPRPKNKGELIIALKREWYAIEQSKIEKLIESMPRRVKAVLDAKGNPTKY